MSPLAIVSHTYVDMGLRNGHADPQDNPGFDSEALFRAHQQRGGTLSGIEKIDPSFAERYPISLTDRAHAFPPRLAAPSDRAGRVPHLRRRLIRAVRAPFTKAACLRAD